MYTHAIVSIERACLFPTNSQSYLALFKCKTFLVSLNNVIIFSETVNDHNRHVAWILKTLSDDRVTLKINKFHLFQRQDKYYLCEMVNSECFQIDKTNVASLHEAQ